MKLISKYLALKSIVDKYARTAPARPTQEIIALIEDMIFEINDEGRVITERVFDNIVKIFGVDLKQAKLIVEEYSKFVKQNKITESIDLQEFVNRSDLYESVIIDSERIVELKEQLAAEYKSLTNSEYVTLTLKLK